MQYNDQQKGSLLAFIAVFLITPDSLLIRLSSIETWGMLFYRGAIPFAVVLIGTLIFYNKNFFEKTLFKLRFNFVISKNDEKINKSAKRFTFGICWCFSNYTRFIIN